MVYVQDVQYYRFLSSLPGYWRWGGRAVCAREKIAYIVSDNPKTFGTFIVLEGEALHLGDLEDSIDYEIETMLYDITTKKLSSERVFELLIVTFVIISVVTVDGVKNLLMKLIYIIA